VKIFYLYVLAKKLIIASKSYRCLTYFPAKKYLYMRFFSKIIFVCNSCFVLSIIFRFVELHSAAKGGTDQAIPLPFVEGALAVLGQLAIVFNLIFCITVLILFLSRKMQQICDWVVIANLIFFIIQVFYFFL